MSYNAGHFNKKIVFQKSTNITDAAGYETEDYVDVFKDSAIVKNVSAREYIEAKTNHNENITRFIVRYKKRYETDEIYDFVIDYKGKKYEIESIINDDERNITFTIIGKLVI